MTANRGSHSQIPFPRVVAPQRFIGENTRRTDFDKVTRELVFENSVFAAAKINGVLDTKRVQVVSSGVFAVKPHAAVALYASVHLVIEERAEVLVAKRALLKPRAAVVMASHDRHVLEMALAAYVAYRTIVRMIQHHPLDDGSAESDSFRIVNGDPRLFLGGRHARHYEFALGVLFILEFFDCTLAARAHGPESSVPAEVRQVKAQRKTCVEQVLLSVCFVWFAVDVNGSHQVRPSSPESTALVLDVPLEIVPKVFQCALQRLRSAWCQCAKRVAGPPKLGLKLQFLQISRFALTTLDCFQNLFRPVQAAPAWSTPAAGLLSKKVNEVRDHTDRTGLIVEHDHGAGPQPAARFLYFCEVHGHVQMLRHQEIGRRAAR